jgi:hypothetical protein
MNKESKAVDALFAAALALNSDLSAMSWSGFNLAGTPESIAELRRLQHSEAQLNALHEAALERTRKLAAALEESLKLQSHYAELLNIYDGGKRLQFATADQWLTRLAATTWKWK